MRLPASDANTAECDEIVEAGELASGPHPAGIWRPSRAKVKSKVARIQGRWMDGWAVDMG